MLGYLAATFVTGLALLLVGGGTIAAWVLGKLSPEEVAKRRVYREALGFPADPAAFVSGLPELRQTLYARVFEAAARLSAQGYRGISDPQREWPRLAEDPTVNDREALAAVLTLSRVERAFVPSMQHAALDQLNERAWSRMRALGFC